MLLDSIKDCFKWWKSPLKDPPLFHDNKFITDFTENSEIFNSFFAKQCSLIDNGCTLPSLFRLITGKSLSDVNFSIEDIKNIINKLDSNEAHGHDMVIICMLKLCDNSILYHLQICSDARHFPIRMEKSKCCNSSQNTTVC